MAGLPHIQINLDETRPPYRDAPETHATKSELPKPSALKTHPAGKDIGKENANIYFIGTATTVIEWQGMRIMTDPNFLHAGDHVHLGPGVQGTRLTDPAVDLHDLPRIDVCLLSHYHADHFDALVEASLRRDLPIVTTPHAHGALTGKQPLEDAFTAVTALDTWDACVLAPTGGASHAGKIFKVTAMPGKHVPPGPAGLLGAMNDLLGAVPPTNGWMLELGAEGAGAVRAGFRIYISGDTLLVDDLKAIPERYPDVDLMLIHLGGTTIPGPHAPLLMVTMDAKMGLQLVHLVRPDVTIPIHYDDYDVFMSPLQDFKDEMTKAGLDEKVVYLGRGEGYTFAVRD